jgi:hypothetical protein
VCPLEKALLQLAIEFFTHPLRFCGPMFFLQALTMVGTYGTANMLAALGIQGAARLVAITFVASALSVHKDTQLAIANGQRVAASFPLLSQLLFLCRDLINTAAVFLLPTALTPHLQALLHIGPETAATTSQFICPLVAQLVQTFVHLLGLTFYNNPTLSTPAHVATVGRQFGKSYTARVSRTAFAYSVGGTLNRMLLARAQRASH